MNWNDTKCLQCWWFFILFVLTTLTLRNIGFNILKQNERYEVCKTLKQHWSLKRDCENPNTDTEIVKILTQTQEKNHWHKLVLTLINPTWINLLCVNAVQWLLLLFGSFLVFACFLIFVRNCLADYWVRKLCQWNTLPKLVTKQQ